MVDTTDNQMSMEDFEKIVNDNPPGTPPPVDDTPATSSTEPQNDTTLNNQTGTQPVASTQTDTTTTNPSAQSNGDNTSKHSANDAFAAMRVQNKKIATALAAVLQQHGLDPNLANDPDKLIQDAENARIEQEAKRQNVPAELLQRLTQLETRDREFQQKRLADAALAGFQTVKDQFGLDSKGIAEFARQLQEAGTNPFEQEINLVQHYKLHNMDKIIATETQRAVEEALKNQKASAQYSTQPSKTQGKESTGTDQIDTMAKFDRFLMGL